MMLRAGTIPACFGNGPGAVTLLNYDVFTEYSIDGTTGQLINPNPFFVAEINVSPGKFTGANII